MFEHIEMTLLEITEKMEEVINQLVGELTSIRTGRANPAILDKITIDYYGVPTPLKQIAGIGVVEGTQLLIKPFDKSTLKTIEQAIYASDLGLTPQNDGTGIRLILPALTGERRKQLSKEVEQIGEKTKVSIRNVRREGNDLVKKLELSEDAEKGTLEDVQKLTDDHIKKIDELVKDKVKEITTI